MYLCLGILSQIDSEPLQFHKKKFQIISSEAKRVIRKQAYGFFHTKRYKKPDQNGGLLIGVMLHIWRLYIRFFSYKTL